MHNITANWSSLKEQHVKSLHEMEKSCQKFNPFWCEGHLQFLAVYFDQTLVSGNTERNRNYIIPSK